MSMAKWQGAAWFSILIAGAHAADSATVATFTAPRLVEAGTPFDLTVHAPGEAKNWMVRWGDGTNSTENAALTALHHTYAKPGFYNLDVAALAADGTSTPALVDYTQLILEDRPAAYYRFGATLAAHGTDPLPASDDSLDAPPKATASGLPWGAPAATFGDAVTHLSPALATPSDRFAVEFWCKAQDVSARQDILSSAQEPGTQVYFADGSLHLELPKGAIFSQPLGDKLKDGAWHHLAISYDRAPLFPFSNAARFYIDGVLAGDVHLDLYDTGAAAFPEGVLGNSADGTHRFQGSLAELAIYAHPLAPHRVLAHVKPFSAPHAAQIMAATPCVTPFTVDEPRITQTLEVPLDPTPGVDNAPTLRAAINQAVPGTRLRVINQATKTTGGTFTMSSLDGGNDWAVFRIMNKQDIELDGGGATFLFETANRQFFLRQCERVAVRNLSVDLDQAKFRVGVYARILDLDTTTGRVRFQFVNGRDLSPDRTVPASIAMWRWRPHDPKTLRIGNGPYFQTGDAFAQKPQRDPNDASILEGELRPKMIPKLDEYRRGPNFFMVNNARFENTSVDLTNSEHITFENVNYYATLGMVFLSSEENHIRVAHCKIGLPPGLTAADRPLASGADGYHFHDTQGDVLFENNEIELTDDDPITIKDGVIRDVSASGSSTLRISHDVAKGDGVQLYKWDFTPIDYQGHIVTLNRGEAQMDRPLPADLPKTFVATNRRHHTDNWIVRDCWMHDYYGRLLLCTPHGMVAGNIIEHSWLHLGASVASFDSSGISSYVTVYNNMLVDTAADTGIWGWGSKYPVFQGITFYENSFIGQGLKIGNAGSPWAVNNYFEAREPKKPDGKIGTASVKLEEAISPTVIHNAQLAGQPGEFGLEAKSTDGMIVDANTTLVSPAKSTATY